MSVNMWMTIHVTMQIHFFLEGILNIFYSHFSDNFWQLHLAFAKDSLPWGTLQVLFHEVTTWRGKRWPHSASNWLVSLWCHWVTVAMMLILPHDTWLPVACFFYIENWCDGRHNCEAGLQQVDQIVFKAAFRLIA